MSLHRRCATYARQLGLPMHSMIKAFDDVSLAHNVEEFLPKMVLALHNCRDCLWLEQLKSNMGDLSDIFANLFCPNFRSAVPPANTMRLFWTVILAIVQVYKDSSRVLECVNVVLSKVCSTTRALRRLSLKGENIQEAENLLELFVHLLSHVLPQPFLIVCRRAPDPSRLMHSPLILNNLDALSEYVRVLLDKAYLRVRETGCLVREKAQGRVPFRVNITNGPCFKS
ncbi:hypothetical protein DL96DRAFT_1613923 [Flagelloscypha sp. PMI_526]|nr:hypothetical protein DL96DRAFT_1613923 [Flagelloscypha sp. PMI_526]